MAQAQRRGMAAVGAQAAQAGGVLQALDLPQPVRLEPQRPQARELLQVLHLRAGRQAISEPAASLPEAAAVSGAPCPSP